MGWIKKTALLLVGVALLGTPLFIVGLLCVGYVIFSAFSRRKGTGVSSSHRFRVSPRLLLAMILGTLSLAAFVSGGFLSPLVFGTLTCLAFFWPWLPVGRIASAVTPLDGTILLRSSFIPFVWHCMAEVKIGAEELPRALSSYEGRLMITRQGAVYAHVKTFALEARAAENKVTSELRGAADSVSHSAYFLPLDGKATADLFRIRYIHTPSKPDDLAGPAPDLLLLVSSRGFVTGSGRFSSTPVRSGRATIPETVRDLKDRPLTWEFLESLGKKVSLPGPDSFSNLLQSVHASRHEPISERLGNLESTGNRVKVTALAGDEVELSRAQLRAIVSIYG